MCTTQSADRLNERGSHMKSKEKRAGRRKAKPGIGTFGLGLVIEGSVLISIFTLAVQLFFFRSLGAVVVIGIVLTVIAVVCFALMWIVTHRTWLEPKFEWITYPEVNEEFQAVPNGIAFMAGMAMVTLVVFEHYRGWSVSTVIAGVVCGALIVAWIYALQRLFFRAPCS